MAPGVLLSDIIMISKPAGAVNNPRKSGFDHMFDFLVPGSVIDALSEYDIWPILWSDRRTRGTLPMLI